MTDSFGARSALEVGGDRFEIYRLDAVKEGHVDRLPYSLKILLENLLRHEDGRDVTRDDILALANWDPKAAPSTEISFTPARVILQDFTGVPAVVDLAAMRDAVVKLGGSAPTASIRCRRPNSSSITRCRSINYGTRRTALDLNNKIEFQPKQGALLVPALGPVRAFEELPRRASEHRHRSSGEPRVLEPSRFRHRKPNGTCISSTRTRVVGTDSHTTMINGLGILGWGVGGIEAEAAMLGQPITMLIPQRRGVQANRQTEAEGTTATDLVLTVTQMLRERGVVGKFVEFFRRRSGRSCRWPTAPR